MYTYCIRTGSPTHQFREIGNSTRDLLQTLTLVGVPPPVAFHIAQQIAAGLDERIAKLDFWQLQPLNLKTIEPQEADRLLICCQSPNQLSNSDFLSQSLTSTGWADDFVNLLQDDGKVTHKRPGRAKPQIGNRSH